MRYQDTIILAMEKIHTGSSATANISRNKQNAFWCILFVSMWASHLSGLKPDAIARSLVKTHSGTLSAMQSLIGVCVYTAVSFPSNGSRKLLIENRRGCRRRVAVRTRQDRTAELCHLTGALLQNRLFLHFPLLCVQLKVIGQVYLQNTVWMPTLRISFPICFTAVFCIGCGGLWDCFVCPVRQK